MEGKLGIRAWRWYVQLLPYRLAALNEFSGILRGPFRLFYIEVCTLKLRSSFYLWAH